MMPYSAFMTGQFGAKDEDDIALYIKLGKLGEAFTNEEQAVLLIDEIDKADLEFPTTCCGSWTKWNSFIPRPGKQ